MVKGDVSEINDMFSSTISRNNLLGLDTKEPFDILLSKLFRKQENMRKMNFLLEHSDVDISIIVLAHRLSNANQYHNFGHQLGVAEAAILFGEAQGCSRNDSNLLAVASLFHDSGHTGIATSDDEIRSMELALKFLPADIYDRLGFTKDQLSDLILATTFSQHGKIERYLAKLLQDADLGNISFGPHYRLYSIMGLVNELGLNYKQFFLEQQKFVDHLESICPGGFLSDGAKKIGLSPQKSLETIVSRPDEVIDYAYAVKEKDILLADFQIHIDKLINK